LLSCPHQIVDNYGYVCCLFFDGSVGLCSFENCPRKIWQIRRILNQVKVYGLHIQLKGLMALMPLRSRCVSKLSMTGFPYIIGKEGKFDG